MEFTDERPIGVSISVGRPGRESAVISARQRYPEIQRREKEYRQLAALALASNWSAYAAGKVDASQIEHRMMLQSVEFLSDGGVELWYDRLELFPGCRIVVTIDSGCVYQNTELAEY